MRGMEKTRTEANLASMGNNIKKLWRWSRKHNIDKEHARLATGRKHVAPVMSG